ncbi:hypothetical protein U1Q18_040308 [Sarracenia purpurea var. burkii]
MENHKVASGAASKVDKAAKSTSVLALTSKVSDLVSVLNVSSNSPAENVSVISEVESGGIKADSDVELDTELADEVSFEKVVGDNDDEEDVDSFFGGENTVVENTSGDVAPAKIGSEDVGKNQSSTEQRSASSPPLVVTPPVYVSAKVKDEKYNFSDKVDPILVSFSSGNVCMFDGGFEKGDEPSGTHSPNVEENVTPIGKEELSPTKETPASVEQGPGEDAVKEKTPVPDEKVEAEQGNTPVPNDKKGEILIFGEDAEREDSGTDVDLEMGVVQVVSEEEEDENEVADGECGAKVEHGDIILSSPLLQSLRGVWVSKQGIKQTMSRDPAVMQPPVMPSRTVGPAAQQALVNLPEGVESPPEVSEQDPKEKNRSSEDIQVFCACFSGSISGFKPGSMLFG